MDVEDVRNEIKLLTKMFDVHVFDDFKIVDRSLWCWRKYARPYLLNYGGEFSKRTLVRGRYGTYGYRYTSKWKHSVSFSTPEALLARVKQIISEKHSNNVES